MGSAGYSLSEELLDDATWVHARFGVLVDFPEHKATVKNTVRQWIPKTLRLSINSETPTLEDPNQAIENALESLGALHKEILRIKAAILQSDLMDLEARKRTES